MDGQHQHQMLTGSAVSSSLKVFWHLSFKLMPENTKYRLIRCPSNLKWQKLKKKKLLHQRMEGIFMACFLKVQGMTVAETRWLTSKLTSFMIKLAVFIFYQLKIMRSQTHSTIAHFTKQESVQAHYQQPVNQQISSLAFIWTQNPKNQTIGHWKAQHCYANSINEKEKNKW